METSTDWWLQLGEQEMGAMPPGTGSPLGRWSVLELVEVVVAQHRECTECPGIVPL